MNRKQRRGIVAVVLSVVLMAPAGAAFAAPSESNVAERAHSRRDHRQFDRPTGAIDRVYAGSVEGAVGSHVWTGDVFGTGVTTTVTYSVEIGMDGVPIVTTVVVEESTLPEGVTSTVRAGTVVTRTDGEGDRSSEDDDSSDGDAAAPPDDEASAADTTSTVEVSATETTTDAPAGTEATVDDPTDDTADESHEATTRFSGRAGVRFAMGERWAGLLILVNGAVGGASVAHVKTILVTPPANGRDDSVADDAGPDAPEAKVEKTRGPERHENPGRDGTTTRGDDRSDKDRRDRTERGKDRRGDGDRRSDSNDDRSNGASAGRGHG
jgi:hypothetical protein